MTSAAHSLALKHTVYSLFPFTCYTPIPLSAPPSQSPALCLSRDCTLCTGGFFISTMGTDLSLDNIAFP